MADIPSAIPYGTGAQGQATFATGPSTAVWAYSPWDTSTVTATAAGTVPVSAASGSTLYRGNVSFGAGTAPSTGSQVTVTFSATLPSVPFISIQETTAASGTINPYVLSASTTAFVIGAGVTPTANQAGTVYSVNYLMSL